MRNMSSSVTRCHGLRATLVVMSSRSHARPPEPSAPRRPVSRLRRRPPNRARDAWRIGTPVVVLLCGGLFVVSAANSDGTDLRPGRYTDLASLVKDESDQYDGLKRQVSALDAQVQSLSAGMSDREVNRLHRRGTQPQEPPRPERPDPGLRRPPGGTPARPPPPRRGPRGGPGLPAPL